MLEDQKKIFSSTFSYSPDSSYYVDMDSYGFELFKNQENKFEFGGREVDSKVYLVKRSEADDTMAIEILICGTSCSPEEAFWLNENTIMLLGTSENDHSNLSIPSIWIYHLDTKELYSRKLTQEIDYPKLSYFQAFKLKDILINAEKYSSI